MTLPWRRAVRRFRLPVRDDSGFSLLEAVIALVVATSAFAAMAAGTMSAIRATMMARESQQAADFMGAQLEAYRNLDFGSVANDAAQLSASGDPLLTNCSGNTCFDPGTGVPERVYTATGAGVPYNTTVTATQSNNTQYKVHSFVTAPNWAQRSYYRRVTVVVTWQDGKNGTTHTRRDSTIITYTQRGLPLPVFKVTPIGAVSKSVNPGATAVFGFTVTNQGAPDRFNLSENDAYTWNWYLDDGDGAYDPTTDTTVMTDTDGDGIIDTGKLDPNGTIKVWMVRTIDSTITTSQVQNTTLSVTSVAQPLAAGGVQTLAFAANVVVGVITPSPSPSGSSTPTPSSTPVTDCSAASSASGSASSGYSLRSYILHNLATPQDSVAQGTLVMSQTSPYASTFYKYSTDVLANQPGRVLVPGIASDAFASSLNTSKVADWRYPVGAKAYSGTAAVNLWVAPPTGNTLATVNLAAYVYEYTKAGSSYAATQVATIPLVISPHTCTGFQQVGGTGAISIPASGNGRLTSNDWLGVRVVNLGTANVRIAYDVLGVYPSALVLPEN
jgi:type II secretory pathway pseudopilin PulG